MGNGKFAATYRKNGRASCGSMPTSPPTNVVRIRRGASVFAGARRRADRVVRPYGCGLVAYKSTAFYRAGGVLPRPYGVVGNAVETCDSGYGVSLTKKDSRTLGVRELFYDRNYKPGSVIDSHLSRRIVANTFQPPSRKQPGELCFLCGVAPDRVYSNGRFHAIGCALTAPFHPCSRRLAAAGGISLLHFSSDRSGRALPVILALWSPDFPHARPFGAVPATVRPGRATIVPSARRFVKQIAFILPERYNIYGSTA